MSETQSPRTSKNVHRKESARPQNAPTNGNVATATNEPPYEIVVYEGKLFKDLYGKLHFLKLGVGSGETHVVQISNYAPTITQLPTHELKTVGTVPAFTLINLYSNEFEENGLRPHKDILNKWANERPKIKEQRTFN